MEEPNDLLALERTGEFRGRYHVLLGALSPLDGIGPEELKVRELLARLESGRRGGGHPRHQPERGGRGHRASIWPSCSGRSALRVTRIARGLPVGGDLEYADEVTLSKALEGRREMS